jgi:hypothetical protein
MHSIKKRTFHTCLSEYEIFLTASRINSETFDYECSFWLN